MPYIKPELRNKFDPLIEPLAQKIATESKEETEIAGNLNYSITTLILRVIKIKFGRVRYWLIALVSGMLKNVSDEFYRRVAAPYEDKKIKENGDIEGYK